MNQTPLSFELLLYIFSLELVSLSSENSEKFDSPQNLAGILYFLQQWTHSDLEDSIYKYSLVIFNFCKWHLHAFPTLSSSLFTCPSQCVGINIDLILIIFSLWACHSVFNLNFQSYCHISTFMPIVRLENEAEWTGMDCLCTWQLLLG